MKVDDFGVKNEPVLEYLKGSPERAELEKALNETANKTEDVPIVIGDKEFKTDEVRYQVSVVKISISKTPMTKRFIPGHAPQP